MNIRANIKLVALTLLCILGMSVYVSSHAAGIDKAEYNVFKQCLKNSGPIDQGDKDANIVGKCRKQAKEATKKETKTVYGHPAFA